MGFDVPDDNDAEEELPDWLGNLGTGSLSGMGDETPSENNDAVEEVPDWLSSSAEAAPADESVPPNIESDEEVPDWLSNIREAEGNTGKLKLEDEPVVEANDDWLADIRESEGNTGELKLPAEDSAVEDDWMAGIREQEESEQPAEEPVVESGNFLDRIQELKAEDGLDANDDEEDWLGGLNADADEPVTIVGAPSMIENDKPAMFANQSDDEAPDWLAGIGGEDEPAEDESAPDWLQNVQEDEASDPTGDVFDGALTDEMIASADRVDDVFPDLPGEEGGNLGELPNWLDKVETGSLDPSVLDNEEEQTVDAGAFDTSVAEELGLSGDGAGLPSWLSEIQPESAEVIQDTGEFSTGTTSPFAVFDDNIEAISDSNALPAFDAAPEADGDIAPAELPSWLQAMRPVGPISPEESESGPQVVGDEERIGPLAGLRDVLPAEPAIVQFGDNLAPQSGRLRILDREKYHARLLHKIVAMAEASSKPPKQSGNVSGRVLRIGIGLAMYILVFAMVLLGLNISSYPTLALPNATNLQVNHVWNLVAGLPQAKPVLVVFDYQPAFAGELNAAAAPLIDHLLINGHPLALMSTTPTGIGVAEQFMQATQSGTHQYAANHDYLNLGFVSGDVAGMVYFATNPRAAAPLVYADGTGWWQYPPFNTISTIRDFGMVVVITDDLETGRAWIEQVQPYLVDNPANPIESTPLVMVASAKTEPLLHPYTQTSPRQLSGLIGGIKGGVYYESKVRPNIAGRYWDGYGIGLTLAFIVIGLGSVSGTLQSLQRRRKEKGAQA